MLATRNAVGRWERLLKLARKRQSRMPVHSHDEDCKERKIRFMNDS